MTGEIEVRVKRPYMLSRYGLAQSSPASVVSAGLYSQPDPALVAGTVYEIEQERVVYLARARLVAARRVGDLEMLDHVQVALDRRSEVSLHDLHVVHVVLEAEVIGAHLLDDRSGL